MAKAGDADAGKAENGVSQDAPTLSQSDIGQSPILTVIRKRLRAANKRLKRIEEIEGARAAGKTLDADQVNLQYPPSLSLHAVAGAEHTACISYVNMCPSVLDGTFGGLRSKMFGWIDKLQQYMPRLTRAGTASIAPFFSQERTPDA